jgi:iron complex transport system ATP-binding protein
VTAYLRVRELAVALSGKRVVDGVNLDVDAGEVVGLVGPNGAGKSTLLKAMAGVLPVTAGDIRLGDVPVGRSRPRELARRLAYVPQDTAMPFDFRVRDVVVMGRYVHHGRFSPTTPSDYAHADAALEVVGATRLARHLVTRLSGGERQLVHFARAIAQQPQAILLDEPTAALDLHHQVHVLSLLRKQAGQGRAIAVVLHDLNHAARFCDRIVLLNGGHVEASGPPEQVLTAARLAETYDVTATVRLDEDTHARRVTALRTLPVASAPRMTENKNEGTSDEQH